MTNVQICGETPLESAGHYRCEKLDFLSGHGYARKERVAQARRWWNCFPPRQNDLSLAKGRGERGTDVSGYGVTGLRYQVREY